jgi:Tol biopolymer transport system component
MAAVALALVAATPAAVWAADPDDDDFASIRPAADDWSYRIVIYNGRGKAVSTPIKRPVIGRPAISPNGKRIVFTSPLTDGSNGRYGLFMARIDGSNLRRLTRPHGVDRDPAWSPDGTMIAYSRDVGGNLVRSSCCTIRWIRLGAGGGAVPGTTGGINPSWSPDGRRLAYERPDGVWVTRRNGGGAYRLAGASGTEPAWSPNGRRIAYVRPNAGKWEIAVRPSRGGAAVARVASNRRIESPSWDPDSRTLYYLRYSGDGYDGRSNTEVWMKRVSSKPMRLFSTVRSIITLSHHANDSGPNGEVDGDGRTALAVGIPREGEPGAANLGAAAMTYGSGSGIGAGDRRLRR